MNIKLLKYLNRNGNKMFNNNINIDYDFKIWDYETYELTIDIPLSERSMKTIIRLINVKGIKLKNFQSFEIPKEHLKPISFQSRKLFSNVQNEILNVDKIKLVRTYDSYQPVQACKIYRVNTSKWSMQLKYKGGWVKSDI